VPIESHADVLGRVSARCQRDFKQERETLVRIAPLDRADSVLTCTFVKSRQLRSTRCAVWGTKGPGFKSRQPDD